MSFVSIMMAYPYITDLQATRDGIERFGEFVHIGHSKGDVSFDIDLHSHVRSPLSEYNGSIPCKRIYNATSMRPHSDSSGHPSHYDRASVFEVTIISHFT